MPNTRFFLPNAQRKSCHEKYLGLTQAAFTYRPIALSVPRGITVPVGQPGGDSNLKYFESRIGSTGLSQKRKLVDHNLGVSNVALATKALA